MYGKYSPAVLLPALRLFIEARNKVVASGFSDNGGAIHSVERILDILALRLKYPHVKHHNELKKHPGTERSADAHLARERGERVLIEHVMPQREFARAVIAVVDGGATDEQILSFIQTSYRLVLLTQEQTTALNLQNRSRMTADRIEDARIVLFASPATDLNDPAA